MYIMTVGHSPITPVTPPPLNTFFPRSPLLFSFLRLCDPLSSIPVVCMRWLHIWKQSEITVRFDKIWAFIYLLCVHVCVHVCLVCMCLWRCIFPRYPHMEAREINVGVYSTPPYFLETGSLTESGVSHLATQDCQQASGIYLSPHTPPPSL